MRDRPNGVDIIDAPGIDSYLPVLRWAQGATAGSVLEIGGGLFSTPVLVGWDLEGYRTATVEGSARWRSWLRARWREHLTVADAREVLERGWDVVLIDHGTNPWTWVEQRAAALAMVRPHCRVALVHDWHIGKGHRQDVVMSYDHYGWYAPDDGTMHTAICSDHLTVEGLEIPGGRVYTGWDDAPTEWPN